MSAAAVTPITQARDPRHLSMESRGESVLKFWIDQMVRRAEPENRGAAASQSIAPAFQLNESSRLPKFGATSKTWLLHLGELLKRGFVLYHEGRTFTCNQLAPPQVSHGASDRFAGEANHLPNFFVA